MAGIDMFAVDGFAAARYSSQILIDTATDTVVKTLQVGDVGPGREPVLGASPNAGNEGSRTNRSLQLGGLRRSFVTWLLV
jgi:hypothetical protein